MLKDQGKLWPALPEFDINDKAGSTPRNIPPDCWLSLYELPSLVFYHLLQQQNSTLPSAEKIIYDCRKQVKDLFKEIEDNRLKPGFTKESFADELQKRNLNIAGIPKAVVRYLTGKPVKDMNETASQRLEKLRWETVERIEKVKRQEKFYAKKPGSKDYIEMKCGHMADFLARDMIRLQKPSGKMSGKPNGTEFQVLQAKLAYYGKNKETLHETFKLCNLTGLENPHPFLHEIKIDGCSGILSFYKEYLGFRLNFLETCISDKNYEDYHFLRLGEKNKNPGQKYIISLTNKLQKEAVMNLPRGLFLQPVINALKASEHTKNLAEGFEKMERVNTAWIIGQYFDVIRNDRPQEFYNYEKSYGLLNKLFDTRSNMRDVLEKKYFSTEKLAELINKNGNTGSDNEIIRKIDEKTEKDLQKKANKGKEKGQIREKYLDAYKEFTNNEKQVRLAKTTDMVLFMMADDIFRKHFIVDRATLKAKKPGHTAPVEIGEGYKLSEIKPGSDQGFLSLQTRVSLDFHYSFETNTDRLMNVKGSVSKPSDLRKKVIVHESIKIKNYGDFRGFMKDRRIVGLLPFINSDEIQFEALQKELDFYKEARMAVFTRIFEFEKAVLNGLFPGKTAKYINHADILKKSIPEDDVRFCKILNLRNAFSHNNYPSYVLFKDFIDGSGFNDLKNYTSGNEAIRNKSIALQFKNLIIYYYNDITTFQRSGC